ncbi:hypothetical protein AG1IA_06605 [Rhizoctonia solani AG-1 IA]|uniref:Uncharacterized protein n=1 Tax=Thanatephorus cucumeris (strain AG1-IA) TaxID=983506 RepID=L8WRG2_THACA|nr:hypothetical protein AG1IA_06605 [Rhizoctonia solani AG-1 IA]
MHYSCGEGVATCLMSMEEGVVPVNLTVDDSFLELSQGLNLQYTRAARGYWNTAISHNFAPHTDTQYILQQSMNPTPDHFSPRAFHSRWGQMNPAPIH